MFVAHHIAVAVGQTQGEGQGVVERQRVGLAQGLQAPVVVVGFQHLALVTGQVFLVDDLMLEWSCDNDFWVRRIAIDHQLCRKDKTNTILLEKILVNNFGSDEFFINKAIGWALRDYSKTNPEWVREFINKYKDKMSSLSVREASKYI